MIKSLQLPIVLAVILCCTWANMLANDYNLNDPYSDVYTVVQDTVPVTPRTGDFINDKSKNPFELKDPKAVDQTVEYDPKTGRYLITEKLANEYYRMPTYMTYAEYLEYRKKKQQQEFFKKLAGASTANKSSGGKEDPIALIPIDEETILDRLFGGTEVDIRPQGTINLTFGGDYQVVKNPTLTVRQQRQGGFDFDMDIQMNVTGKIGEKLNLSTNYNTQATFDFDNQMKLDYNTANFSEDEILRKIEAGNVSFPLPTQLISGPSSLFGLATELQFGALTIGAVASQQKSQRKQLQIQGGSQIQEFEVNSDQYDENRHFFLSHFNRDAFEPALENMPQVNSLFRITRSEVWITNDRNITEGVRDIVAIADLGEYDEFTNQNPNLQTPTGRIPDRDIYGTNTLPDNGANDIYQAIIDNDQVRNLDGAVRSLESSQFGFQQTRDFEKVRARLLNSNEYFIDEQLGFISINVNLRPDQVLAVAYEFTYNGENYKVGEFSNDSPTGSDTLSVLFTKLLKSTTQRIDLPTWDLMMKNIYNIGAYQVDPKDFRLDVFYEDPGAGLKRFLPETDLASIPLVRLFNLDNLNIQGDPQPDGIFDFVERLTINTSNGRVMFPVLEPFGSSLKNRINNPILAERYSYQQLYDSTLVRAREFPELNRFTIKGSYKSSITSEISLGGFNIPEGSVRVTSGAQQMIEGIDYEIDYGIGRVRILNDALLNSGVPINVSFEDNALFGLNQRTMVGLRADYKVSEHLNLGATFMQLFERPFTQKVNIGEDPINNKIYGLDINYSNDAPWLTRLVDKIPLIDTKEASSINFSAEAAFLKPGHSKAINQGDDEGGTVNLDDFEGTVSNIDLRQPTTQWTLASIPQREGLDNKFPEGEFINNTVSGVNRAHLSWYRIDGSARTSIDSAAYNRAIPIQEVFPNRNIAQNQSSILQTLDLTYYPDERGPYNFDLPGNGTAYSAGVEDDGRLTDPGSRWGGIMRAIRNTDFQQQNIEFVEFWLMDPFMRQDDGTVSQGGKLFMNIGSISEDILRDSRRFFENGVPDPNVLPVTPTDQTEWGIIPRTPAVNNNFTNDPAVRAIQDIGFDGLDDAGETAKFEEFLAVSTTGPDRLGSEAVAALISDPSSDNFTFFRDPIYTNTNTVIDKYKYNFNPQGNSTDQGASSNQNPDSEDLNRDNTLNESEAYYEYEIPITPEVGGGLQLNDFIVDQVSSLENNPNGDERIWYKFRIPIDQYTSKVGGIQDFRAMRFIRLYMTDFQERVTMRFARFDLVRNQWRVYNRDLKTPGIFTQTDNEGATTFDVSAINIEENASKEPFNYVLPVGILREQSVGAFPNILQNEQSLQLNACNLGDGDARGVFKNNINLDMRVFERLKMFVHAESQDDLQEGEVSMFIRLGSDFQENFYEYEVPLRMSDKGITPPPPGIEASEDYRREVWLEDNELDFALDLFPDLKIDRNKLGLSKASFHERPDPEKPQNTVRVIGNPNLGFVKSMLVGIRNRLDDGTEKCFEVWINELRLSGLDERGGAAAIARMDMQLADFADVSVSANYSTIGFGQLEEKVNERAREESIQFDVAANMQLDKFLNPNWGLKIPFHWQISRDIKNPEYDPYDLDINFKEKLNEAPAEQRDSIRDQAQDVTNITSYNFTNVRKERVNSQRTPKPWDIENFSFSYAFTETDSHDPIIESDNSKQYRGSVDYGFNTQPKYIQPFKGLVKDSKALKWLGAFNFNPIPNSFGVSGAIDRLYAETKYRFAEPQFSTFYNKRFVWDRNYDLQWDLSKSLKLSFNASNNSVIDEDPGAIAEGEGTGIEKAFSDFGRNKNYQHNININYTLPFKQIPILDFASGKAQLATTYGWSAAALNVDSLGNVIQNTQTRQLSGDLNFKKLYKKVGYLDKILKKPRPSNSRSASADKKKEEAVKEKKTKKSRKDKKQKGEEEELTEEEARAAATKAKDAKKAADKKKEDKKASQPSTIERVIIRPLLLLDKARISYSESYANIVPGFLPRAQLFGQSGGLSAPGFGFALGEAATTEWLDQAADDGWITSSPFLSQEVVRNKTENLDLKLTLEPFNDFRVDVEWNRSFTENHLELFKRKGLQSPTFDHGGARDVGSYDISFAAFKTIFDKDINSVFANFEEARKVISGRLGTGDHLIDEGFTENYGRTQLEVLIPAFVSAYSGQNPNTIGLDVFKYKPRPNWRLTYNGLTKIPFFKKIFTNFSLTHGYRSNMTLSSYNTELQYLNDQGERDFNPATNSYYSRFEIPNVVISEQFLPLLGLDIRLKNNMSFKLDYKKSRNLSMSFVDYQLAESKTTDFVFNFGYRLKNIDIPFFTQFGNPDKKKKTKKKKKKDTPKETTGGNDLNFAFDISIRDDITVNHLLDQGTPPIPTRGSKTISVQPSVDYNVSEQLNLRLFVDYRKTVPATSASFPITNTSGGIQVRFSL